VLKASDLAANFSRLSTAISWVILSMTACLKAISRSLRSITALWLAIVSIRETTVSRSCCAFSWSRCVALITRVNHADSRAQAHWRFRQLHDAS
jgi:hypothetical protein